jgi:hypothetical protein
MPAKDIFVQVNATPMDRDSGQPIGEARTVMVEVPGPRIDAIAEDLASDAGLQLLARVGHPGVEKIEKAALPERPPWTAARPPDFTYDGMNVWEA